MHNEASKQTQVGSQWAFIPKTKGPGTSLRVACPWSHTLMQLADSEWGSWKAKNNFLEQDVTLSVYFNFKKCCHWKIWKSAKRLLCNFLKMEFALFAPLTEKTVYFIYIPHITQLLYPCSMLVQAAVPEFWVDRVYSGPLSQDKGWLCCALLDCQCFLPVYDFPFHFLNGVFWCEEAFNFEEAQIVNLFSLLVIASCLLHKTFACSPTAIASFRLPLKALWP